MNSGPTMVSGPAKHLLEGDLARELHAHHDHPRHPEEQDVMASLQQRRGVKLREVCSLLGPLEYREWEESRGEPGVQHIIILPQIHLLSWESTETAATSVLAEQQILQW